MPKKPQNTLQSPQKMIQYEYILTKANSSKGGDAKPWV